MNKQRIVIILLLLMCVIFVCGCGAENSKDPVAVPDLTAVPASSPSPTPLPTPTPTPPVNVLGKEYSRDITAIDLTDLKNEDVPQAVQELKALESLQQIDLPVEGENLLTLDNLTLIREALPAVKLNCAFELYSLTVSSTDTEITFVKEPIGNDGADTLRQAIPLLSSCTRLLLDNCGLDNEVLAELRDEFPQTKIVWSILISNHPHYTDIERIRTTAVDNKIADLFKYFTDVKYIDMGHRKVMTNWEFLSYMPHLQVLVVSITDFSDKDLWYLTNCPELEFLEMFSCRVTDLTPLAECTSLQYLNIGNLPGITDISPLYGLKNLKRLRICQDNVPQEQKDEITQLLPDCEMLFAPGHPGFSGNWRYDDDGNPLERYALLYEQFDYQEWPWADWQW
ncbi:MAG: hypothetical protein J6P40_01505 [Oscillospiraceae bacterium]|nr:hypothetical protein [Oscillospiraceae bacterium]